MVTELARGIRPSLIQGCFHSSTGNLISFYPTTNRHFVLQAGDGALGCPSYQFCALPPITGLQLLVRKPQGLFHILCIGYDAWQQYVQALRPPRLIGSRGNRSRDLSISSRPLCHLSYRWSVQSIGLAMFIITNVCLFVCLRGSEAFPIVYYIAEFQE